MRAAPRAWAAALLLALGAAGASADAISEDAGPGLAVAGRAADASRDPGITTRVKARLAARHFSTLSTVKVTTDKEGIVWLSGTVPTVDASAMAAEIAKDTDGVIAVHNGIRVQ